MKTLILLAAFIAFLYLLRKRSASQTNSGDEETAAGSGEKSQQKALPSAESSAQPNAQPNAQPAAQQVEQQAVEEAASGMEPRSTTVLPQPVPPQLSAHLLDEIAQGLLDEPLVKVVLLARRIERSRSKLESLTKLDKAENAAELRIIKEQLRCAAFEKDLLLSVFTGHHPNQSAIDTDWCFTAAELYLKFADERLKTLN
jgi:hypothetical protein